MEDSIVFLTLGRDEAMVLFPLLFHFSVEGGALSLADPDRLSRCGSMVPLRRRLLSLLTLAMKLCSTRHVRDSRSVSAAEADSTMSHTRHD
jgi:hypothetical protein